jgi:hypothetical protein
MGSCADTPSAIMGSKVGQGNEMGLLRAPHTSAPKGKRVRVVLRNGEVFVDKFVERTARHVVFETRAVRTRDLKSFTITR